VDFVNSLLREPAWQSLPVEVLSSMGTATCEMTATFLQIVLAKAATDFTNMRRERAMEKYLDRPGGSGARHARLAGMARWGDGVG